MADRHLFHSRHQMASSRVGTGAFPRTGRGATGGGGGGGGNSSAPAPASASASASVRRNLFQSQLTRRPTPAASVVSTSSAGSSSDGLRTRGGGGGGGGGGIGDGGRGDGGPTADGHPRLRSEIVVRDRNGEVELMDPPSPPADELSEMALDARQESERQRQRLADTIKYHQQRSSIPGQPEDLLEALRASLRAKVSALADDNWMYEPEDMPRLD